jgi:phthalate 4,5-dioxygenase oxygenase subunit
MLSVADNEILTRVGAGTAMGNVLREYWLPVMRSDELPENDGDPLRVRLLGEDLLIFRATDGRIGLLKEACPHRGASLFFGRNEEGGIRCVYHGWKFDVTGQCVDMPSEPNESNFKDKIKARGYTCVDYGNMIWTYMGQASPPPPMPDLEWANLPAENVQLNPFMRECNWVQALEGDIDTAHLFFLHSRLNPDDPPSLGAYHDDKHPRLEVVKTDYGLVYGANRDEDDSTTYWRITQFMFPFHTLFPGYPDGTVPGHIWVPLDDNHTMVWTVYWNPVVPMSETVSGQRSGPGVGEFLPAISHGLGRWRPAANASNDYQIDRQLQRTKTFTGIPTIPLQDQAVVESMGTIYDRSHEHLGTSDGMVIQVRRRLIQAALAHQADGTLPPGVANPEWYRVRSGSATLSKGASWLEEMSDWLNARTKTIPDVNLAVPR